VKLLQALDKTHFRSFAHKNKLEAQPKLFICIVLDKANKTLSIVGGGMTKYGSSCGDVLLCFTSYPSSLTFMCHVDFGSVITDFKQQRPFNCIAGRKEPSNM
jgi:hypothetical protein